MIAIEQSKNELTQQLDREPTMKELANAVEKTETQIRAALYLGQKAKQKMVTANLRLVVSVAKKYQNRNARISRFDSRKSNWFAKGYRKV